MQVIHHWIAMLSEAQPRDRNTTWITVAIFGLLLLFPLPVPHNATR